MRRSIVAVVVVALSVLPGLASAKLPSFGFEANPLHPRVGDPITVTVTCYLDRRHTRPMSSCFGSEGVMAWVHPLDDAGDVDRDDWIAVYGHPTSNGASRGTITLREQGPYDVVPPWRRWAYTHSEGFPDPIRIEVERPGSVVPIRVAAAVAIAAVALMIRTARRRTTR